jgi:hypothetical protein
MNASGSRIIYAQGSSRQLQPLLQAIFVAECLSPSPSIWIVSPWITDIPILDNQTGSLSYLEPSWGPTNVSFSLVLVKLLSLGTNLYVATRPDEHNRAFLNRLRDRAPSGDSSLHLFQADELHEKGILGSQYFLSGSMNFTYNGIFVTEELAHYYTSPEIVAENRIRFANRWRRDAS